MFLKLDNNDTTWGNWANFNKKKVRSHCYNVLFKIGLSPHTGLKTSIYYFFNKYVGTTFSRNINFMYYVVCTIELDVFKNLVVGFRLPIYYAHTIFFF